MARYNREFLVPYLRDACALQLANAELSDRINNIQYEIQHLEKGQDNPYPNISEPTSSAGNLFGPVAFLAGLFWVMFIIGSVITGDPNGGMFLFVLAIVATICAIPLKRIRQRDLTAYAYQKEQALDEYRAIYKANEERKKRIPYLKNELNACIQERNKVLAVLNRVYNANVVPRQYRDAYASVYLYDFFSTSQSDDLEMALNTFVLEQIKSRLDEIISQQRSIILNQEISMANQCASIEAQQAYQARMESKARQITANLEEQNTYLDMISCHTAASAYFSAANYFKN